MEKVPHVALALAGAMIAYLPHQPVTLATPYPWDVRAAVTLHSLWFYVGKTIVPQGLSPIYELPPRIDPWAPEFLAAAVGVAAITAGALVSWRRWPAGLAVWVSYGITLAPVSGAVFTGWLAADRYGYLACLGFALLFGGGVGVLAEEQARRRLGSWWAWLGRGAMAAGIVGLAVVTGQQLQVWRDTESLWRHAVRVTPQCFICQTNRGLWLLAQGSPGPGLTHLQLARAVRPDLAKAHVNLGLAFTQLGLLRDAIETYEQALGRFPGEAAVPALLGEVLLKAGRARESIPHFRRAIALDPAASIVRLGLIRAHLAAGDMETARREYEALRERDPALADRTASAFQTRP
jgi:Tfp pilus assembly protein PilF